MRRDDDLLGNDRPSLGADATRRTRVDPDRGRGEGGTALEAALDSIFGDKLSDELNTREAGVGIDARRLASVAPVQLAVDSLLQGADLCCRATRDPEANTPRLEDGHPGPVALQEQRRGQPGDCAAKYRHVELIVALE